MAAGVKIIWTSEMVDYIKESFGKLTCREMAAHLGLSMDAVRAKYREFGLKAVELEYWTEQQIIYLKENFRKCGDVELAIYFDKKWPKNKPWTRKHIEKKRKYLNLNRSQLEISQIRWGNYHKGLMHSPSRFVDDTFANEGEVRMWKQPSGRLIPRIKINGIFEDWNNYMWRLHYGTVPKGFNVVFKGDPSVLQIENLELKTNLQLAKDMFGQAQKLTDKYVLGMITRGQPELREFFKEKFPELIQLKKEQLKLQREINNENI